MGGFVSYFQSEKGEYLPPIRLISLDNLKKAGSFPIYPNNQTFTCELDSINPEEYFIVFISHHWYVQESSANTHPVFLLASWIRNLF